MPKEYKKRQSKAYNVDVEVSYARLFLKAKERMLKMKKAGSSTTGNSEIKKAYRVVDEVIYDVMLAEEESLNGIYALLETENAKFNSEVIKEIIAILKQWNKIPANEIKAKVGAIKPQKI